MKLTEKYTWDQFSEKINGWLLLAALLVLIGLIVLTVVFPMWFLLIPFIACIGLVIFCVFWVVFYGLSCAVKWCIEIVCGEAFRS